MSNVGFMCLLVLTVLIYLVSLVVHGNCLLCVLFVHVLYAETGTSRVVPCFCPLHMPFDPWRVWGQFMIWLWCYNTIGLQWCCSSSLTLLAPPTGPLLPTLLLLLCLLGSAPCSRQAMYGWPMRRWRPWQPLPKRSVPLCPLPSPFFLFLGQSCVSGVWEWISEGLNEQRPGWWLTEKACVI